MRLYLLRPALIIPLLLLTLLLNACSRSGPVRRISEPAASIQQLTVDTGGQWALELRLQNFSSIPMRFEKISLALRIADVEAGVMEYDAALVVGPESADVLALTLSPSPHARLMIADALAGGRGVAYQMEGTVNAGPHDRDKSRSYTILHRSTLNPMPGLPGVLR